MKIRAVKEQGETFPKLTGGNDRQRIAPPKGVVKHQPRARAMNMARLGNLSELLPMGVTRVLDLKFISDEKALINAVETKKNFELVNPKGIEYVVTDFYRDPARDSGDHSRGLAVDVSYGDYEKTHAAFLVLEQSKEGVIKQLIFENVRGTPRGYHIHIGFYAPGSMGIIESKLYYSAKANKLRAVGDKRSPYTKVSKTSEIPGKEYFEND